jgi:hypothetical protein
VAVIRLGQRQVTRPIAAGSGSTSQHGERDRDSDPVSGHDSKKSTPPKRQGRGGRGPAEGSDRVWPVQQETRQQEEQGDTEVHAREKRRDGTVVQRPASIEANVGTDNEVGRNRPHSI